MVVSCAHRVDRGLSIRSDNARVSDDSVIVDACANIGTYPRPL
jgi:hypothetical protein